MNFNKAVHKKIFTIISNSSQEINQYCYVIGGFVRDFFLGKKNIYDIDIVTLGKVIFLAKKVSKNIVYNPKINLFKRFGTAMLKYKNKKIEFISARKESYTINSRKPFIKKGSLEDDQNRRDFTINTLAISLNKIDYGNLLDPFRGLLDIKKTIIRTPLNPNLTYSDDPLRMMRAFRFSSELNFSIEKFSFQAIFNNKLRIQIVSLERIINELNKIILSKKPSIGIYLLYRAGLLSLVLPELEILQGIEEKNGYKHKDNFFHTLEVIDNISIISNSLWLRWAGLLHDIGKSITKKYIHNIGWTFHSHEYIGYKMIPKIFQRLKLPMGLNMKFIQKIIKNSSRPISLIDNKATDSAIRRLLFDIGNDIDDLLILCKSDITTKDLEKKNYYYNNFFFLKKKIKEIEEKDHIRNFKFPISGKEIMKLFNLKPCKKVGIIKNFIKEAIIEGKISNNYDEAIRLILKKKEKFFIEKKKI